MCIKHLDRKTPDGTYVLTSFNPAYDPLYLRGIKIYGVVVEVRTPFQVVTGNHN